jgi:hypothetical protein
MSRDPHTRRPADDVPCRQWVRKSPSFEACLPLDQGLHTSRCGSCTSPDIHLAAGGYFNLPPVVLRNHRGFCNLPLIQYVKVSRYNQHDSQVNISEKEIVPALLTVCSSSRNPTHEVGLDSQYSVFFNIFYSMDYGWLWIFNPYIFIYFIWFVMDVWIFTSRREWMVSNSQRG